MIYLLLVLILLEILAFIVPSLHRRETLIQFPFLTLVSFVGYLLPQLTSLADERNLPDGALQETMIMIILSLAGAYYGYKFSTRPVSVLTDWELSRKRLVYASVFLTMFGGFFYILVGSMAAEASMMYGGQWTGIITIYVFLGQALTFGLIIAMLLVIQKPSLTTVLTVAIGLMFYLDKIVMEGRRTPALELFLIVALALWFTKRITVPRWVMIIGVVVGILAVNSIQDYRTTMLKADRTTWTGAGIHDITQIPYIENLKKNFTVGAYDLRNAVYRIAAVDEAVDFDFGFSLYNQFITKYVPAQILGQDVKEGLLMGFFDNGYGNTGYRGVVGTTQTGIADAYASFWFFGAIKFFLIGFIFRKWFLSAQQGRFTSQVICLAVAYPALLAFPFSTHHFFLKFFEVGLFIIPVFAFCRVRARASPAGGEYAPQTYRSGEIAVASTLP